MDMGKLAKGIGVGMAVGAMTYALSNSSKNEKKSLKSNTGKAVKAIGDVFTDISSMMS